MTVSTAGQDPRQSAPKVGLRVLMVSPRYVPHMGGVENHVYQVARRLVRTGLAVGVLTTDPDGELPAREQSEGIDVQRVPAWPASRDYYFAPDVYRSIVRGGWDIVHCQCYHTLVAPVAMLAAWRAGIPYVLTFHGGGHSSRLRHALRGAQWAALRPLLARARRLIAVAQFEVALFGKKLRLPQDRFLVIPNGCDLPPVVQPAAAAPDGTLVLSVGRLERYKGHHRVLAALPHVLERRPEVRLAILGAGPYEPALRRLARELGVADRVEIRAIPATDRQAMATELSRAALVTLLSEYETHPLAVLEALALGRPVLLADTSGLSELGRRGLGRTVPLKSRPADVARAVLAQLERPLVPTQLSLPTWDQCAERLSALYAVVARESSCAS